MSARGAAEHVGTLNTCPICAGLGWLTRRTPSRVVVEGPCWACTPQPIAA